MPSLPASGFHCWAFLWLRSLSAVRLWVFCSVCAWLALAGRDDPHQSMLELTFLFLFLSLLQVFRTNTSYRRWDEARKNWGMNINHTR